MPSSATVFAADANAAAVMPGSDFQQPPAPSLQLNEVAEQARLAALEHAVPERRLIPILHPVEHSFRPRNEPACSPFCKCPRSPQKLACSPASSLCSCYCVISTFEYQRQRRPCRRRCQWRNQWAGNEGGKQIVSFRHLLWPFHRARRAEQAES